MKILGWFLGLIKWGGMDWNSVVLDTHQWRAHENTVMNQMNEADVKWRSA